MKNQHAPDGGRTLSDKAFHVALAVLCASLTACGNVPNGQRIIDREAAMATPAFITNAHSAFNPEKSAALFRKAGVPDYLMHHLAVEQAINQEPLIDGNSTRLLVDGDETFNAIFNAIKGAHSSINMEFFIFEDVKNGNESLSDLLIRKRRQGVAVNVIYDSFGSGATPPEFFNRLKKAGVKLVQYNPVAPFEVKRKYAPNHRDHRKIIVVDGVIAFTGGINLSRTYESSWSGRSGPPRDLGNDYWRDTDIEIKGPAVAVMQHLFLDHWKGQKGPEPDKKNYFPPLHDEGNELIRVIGSHPGHDTQHYYATLLSALQSARARIWLTAAYFVPTDEQADALLAAAHRGVDVRILVPARSDSQLSLVMQHADFEDLLKAGVKIFETHDEVLHSKSVVIDGVWSVIGSSNFDHRSVVFNDEADVVVVGRKTGAELESLFVRDCAQAKEVTWHDWKHRNVMERTKELLATMWLSVFKSDL